MRKILEKIFGGAATGVAEGLAGIVDKFVRTKEEKDAFEKENAEAKEQAMKDFILDSFGGFNKEEEDVD